MEKEGLHPFEFLHPIVVNAVLSKQSKSKLPSWGIKRFEAKYIKTWFDDSKGQPISNFLTKPKCVLTFDMCIVIKV